MMFSIRFREQLSRTRPSLIKSLEEAVTLSASSAGALFSREPGALGPQCLGAQFDRDRIGFWLKILVFCEEVHRALQEAEGDLYGAALTLGAMVSEEELLKFSSTLGREGASYPAGIWCSPEVQGALEFFCIFGGPSPLGDFRELLSFRSPGMASNSHLYENQDWGTLRSFLDPGGGNLILLGPKSRAHIKGIYHFFKDESPLRVSFGAGGRGLVCFADAFSQAEASMAPLLAPEVYAELKALSALLFRERLRDEWSPYTLEKGRSFVSLLLRSYAHSAASRGRAPLLIIQEPSGRDLMSRKIFLEVYGALEKKIPLLALDSSGGETLRDWMPLFSQVSRSPGGAPINEDDPAQILQALPESLLETLFFMSLLGRYFPSELFPQLFEEEDLSPQVYQRSLGILEVLGLVRPEDPRLDLGAFESFSSAESGIWKDRVRQGVRNRILAWTDLGRIRPCFNLLRILLELGQGPREVLVLRSLRADILNGTWEGIEEALRDGSFPSLVSAGPVSRDKVRILFFIYKTQKALLWGTQEEIHGAFKEPPPRLNLEDEEVYEGYQAQVLFNQGAYDIGIGNLGAASESVRKLMQLNQKLGKDGLSAHRLFALVHFSRQRLDDAMEYIGFALEHAGRSSQHEELILSCYYGASIYFIQGNLTRSLQLALRAEETARTLGLHDWENRIKLLKGRIYFEVGLYEDALLVFEAILSSGMLGRGAFHTAAAWRYRALVFLNQNPGSELGIDLSGSDGRIFEIEGAYYGGDHQRVLRLAEAYASSLEGSEQGFSYTEQPDWKSGYSQCEYMFQNTKASGARTVWVYRTLAQYALESSPEMKLKYLGAMQRFIRDELQPDSDPYDAFFFHSWYLMLKDYKDTHRDSQNPRGQDPQAIDITTLVSMAYKRLQRRAGRIDDLKTKQAFLGKSRWNSAIYLAARENNLL